ncbi:hypothetical protein Acr_00g0045300 [Actinidia rufa]|uniref:Uncharacterized protein n=1 Tax=Actinidia rufa TaxID=165716 RepID=A0A7J0DJ86_9ERIC|nr:hypothetical protein Acr_00g0045300 [Actinidia rufa]
MPAVDTTIIVPFVSQVLQCVIDPIVEFAKVIIGVELSFLKPRFCTNAKGQSSQGVCPRGIGEGQERPARVWIPISRGLNSQLLSSAGSPLRKNFGTMRSLLVMQHVQFAWPSKSDDNLGSYGRVVDRAEEGQEEDEHSGVVAAKAAIAQLQAVACGPIYEQVFNRGASRAGDNYSKQVIEVCSKSFLEGWLTYLAELGILEDNPAWTKVALIPEFPESPMPYSPMILSSFDEEKYVNRPDEAEDVPKPLLARDVAPTNRAANPTEETGEMIARVSRERSVEETGRDDGEDASQDPPHEL